MKTFKQFLNEMTHEELELKIFFNTVMGIHGEAQKEATEWYYKRLDLDDAKTDVKTYLFLYFENKNVEIMVIDKFNTDRMLRNHVFDEFMTWVEENEDA